MRNGQIRELVLIVAAVCVVGVAAVALLERSTVVEVSAVENPSNNEAFAYVVAQNEVDFQIVRPEDTLGLNLVGGEARVTGPDETPIVVATYGWKNNSQVRVMTFSQSSGGFGEMGFYGQQPERILVAGHTGLLAVSSNEYGDDLAQIYWEADGTHYWITGVNVSPEDLVNVSGSLKVVTEE